MLNKIFRSQKSGHAAFLLMLASLLSYIAGLKRDNTLANTFGASSFTDAYNASFLIPDFFFNLFIAGALSVAFVPVFASYLKIDKKQANSVANTILTFGTLLLLVVSVISFFLTPYIVPAIFNHVQPEDHTMIITMTRIMLLSPILFAISNTLGSILITHKHFLAYALSGFFYNAGIILGIILLSEQFGIYAAAIGAVIGAFFHLAIRFLNILTIKFEFRPQLSLKHEGIRKIFKLMIPKTIGLVSWQITLWVYTWIAFSLQEGSVAAFNYARNLQSFPVSLFGIAFATAIFPFLSDHAHHEDTKRFSYDFQNSLEKILFFVIPSTIGMLLLHREVIEIILSGGAFDEKAATLTASVFFFFILSIPIESMIHLFARGYYAHKNTILPMIFMLIGVTINITLCIYTASIIGVKALPIAFLVGSSVQLILQVIFLHKKIAKFNLGKFFIKFSKIGFATLAMGLSVYYVPQFIETSFLTTQALRVIVGSSLYLGLATLLKCNELNFFKNLLLKLKPNNGAQKQ